MIKLTKLPEPEILKSNKTIWTEQYLDCLQNSASVPDSIRYRYRSPEIKETIRQETHDKCAYCESKIPPVCPGDIEHIIPKSKRPELIFEWTNLTLACPECNRRKSDYYDETLPLLNPYCHDPEEHLAFYGPMILHRPTSSIGRFTRKHLELNRPALFEQRKERLEVIQDLLDLLAKQTTDPARNAIQSELEREMSPDKEYSATVRAFLTAQGIL